MTDKGIELIVRERTQQVEKHGKTVELDFKINNHYQLSQAASILCWVDKEDYGYDVDACCPVEWNLNTWRKMMCKPYTHRLAIAGALLAAEIDRIDYLHNHECK
jgi:hypothetical protein